MLVNFPEFSEKFLRLNPLPVYMFSGEERFFIDEGVSIVKGKFLEEGVKDFNYDLYSASEIGADKVIDIAETLPVMAVPAVGCFSKRILCT